MLKLKIFYIFTLIFFLAASPMLSAQVIKDDFRVNDDTTGGDNFDPDVEITESGEEMIVWRDSRNGNNEIYGQAFDNGGIAVGNNFLVGSYRPDKFDPAISSYGDSLIIIYSYGSGQWFLSDGSPQGTSFPLANIGVYSPDVAISDSGFFAVWYYYLTGVGREIFLKRFDFNGDSIGTSMIVNDDGTSESQSYPKIAINQNGCFVVVWQDYRNGNYDIYGQRFDNAGNKIGSNFLINDDTENRGQSYPSCAMDSAGNFVVVWQDSRNENDDIYGQRFDSAGNGIGSNFLINDDTENRGQSYPSCAMDKEGNFVVVWEDHRDWIADIYGQRFDNTGSYLGGNFHIDQGTGPEAELCPRISMNESNFVVTWFNINGPIYKRRFLNDGTPAGDQVRVKDFEGTEDQESPAIDMNTSGYTVITWFDYRNPSGIYFQRLNALGDILGSNISIDYGYNPDVAVSEDSSFFITFDEYSDIYYQRFSPFGDSIDSLAVISNSTHNSREYPVIDVDSGNNVVVAWEDTREGNSDIYAQIVDSAGNTAGSNFKVNDDIGTTDQYLPAIAMAPSGNFLITWYDRRNFNYDIYGQIFDSQGNPIGSNFRIDSGGGTSYQRYPDAGYLPEGKYIVVWLDYRSPSGVYAQIIDSIGNLVDTNFMVSEQSGDSPFISVAPSGKFVVTWCDSREGDYNIYAQRYNPDCTPDGSNYRVNNEFEGLNTTQDYPDVATNLNNIIFVWQDAKWQRGWDIAAKVFSWSGGGIDDVETEGRVFTILGISSPILRGKEWLTFSVDSPSEVDFKIINVVGIVVSSKKINYATPGIKKLNFDVSKLPSGPYFLSFKTEKGKAVKKTLIIR